MEVRRIPKKIVTYNPKEDMAPTVKMEGQKYSSRGRNRPGMV
jgi:hypothetical protein